MTIKFLNLNLLEGGLLFPEILKFIHAEQPDILSLQEVYNSQDPDLAPNFRSMEVLKQALPEHFFYYSPELLHRVPEGDIDIGNAIFSRFPIKASETHFFGIPYEMYSEEKRKHDYSQDPKNIQHVELDMKGKSLHVFNLHGIWGRHGYDTPARLLMSQIIVETIQGKKPMILSGDFNVRPNTQTIRNIESHLTNVFSGELSSTFNMKRKADGGYASSVVDMIFISHGVRVLEKKCPQVDISDHLPLVCVFSLG